MTIITTDRIKAETSKEPRSKLRGILEGKLKPNEKSKQASRNSTQEIKNHHAITKTVQQTLDEILTPEQKAAYQQMLAEDQKAQADNMATSETNKAASLLQLSDAQKDQVYAALYQVELQQSTTHVVRSQDDLNAWMNFQVQAKENALQSILTLDQMAIYRRQLENQLQAQQAAMNQSFQQSAATRQNSPGVPVLSGATAQ